MILPGGRLDKTAHPFSTDIGPGDVRITTRFDEHRFNQAFFGTLHETGHALYDQGLPAAHWGTPRGDTVSLGIHESQSRLWENLVGRSLGFWRFFYPRVQASFPVLQDVPLGDFSLRVNEVKPSLIRTEADEVTYNLHILLRFELERALLNGDLQVEDLPGAFNDKMRASLGLTPPDPGQGVMQDIHWSAGLFGYFPTYTLGNLYAAQFYARAEAELGPLEEQIRRRRLCAAAHLAPGEDSLPGPPLLGPAPGAGGDRGGPARPYTWWATSQQKFGDAVTISRPGTSNHARHPGSLVP